MSIELIINGVTYDYPEEGDNSWADDATSWASAITSGVLQKAGGTFTLLADVDFGANYGLKSLYYTSRTANPASAGNIRLANTDSITFRNAANSADLTLDITGDALYWEGVDISSPALSNPMTTEGDIITGAASGNPQRVAAGTEGYALKIVSGVPAWAALGGGDVVGPGSATDNALARYDNTTGKLLQNCAVIADDSGNLSGIGNISLTGTVDGVDVAGHAADSTIHFVEGVIDHTNILNIGTNAHSVIDTHLGSSSNPHTVTKTQVSLGNVLDAEQITKAIGTTKGDIIGFAASATPSRLGIGTDDQVLTADSAEATGLKWADVGGGLTHWAEDGSGHLLPDTQHTYNIGSASYAPAWVHASCTRIGGDGGFQLNNITDTQTFVIRYHGNNSVMFLGATEGKFYYGMNFVGTVRPNTNGSYDLGTVANGWRSIYLDDDTTNGGAIFFNNSTTSFIKSDSAGTTLNIDGFTTLLDFSSSGEIKIKYYSQATEPTLTNNQAIALWEDTDDSSVHLLVKNAAGTQTKLSFA